MIRTEAEAAYVSRRLEELHRRLTRYEIVAELADGRKFLLGYRVRVGKRDLLRAPGESGKGDVLVHVAGIEDSDPFVYSAVRGWTFGAIDLQSGKCKLKVYKGRTERTAILEGELESVQKLS